MKSRFLAVVFVLGLLLAIGRAESEPVGHATFLEVEHKKDQLKDKIVLIELVSNLGEGSKVGDGMLRFIAKDSSGSAAPYGQVVWPEAVLKKVNAHLAKGPYSFYFRVHVFGGKAAALFEGIGTTFTGAGNKAKYSWD